MARGPPVNRPGICTSLPNAQSGTLAEMANPKVKSILYPVIAAILGALASFFASSCTPAQVDAAQSAAHELCRTYPFDAGVK